MFDIGWSEMLVIGVVALIAIGPKELPGVLRTIGQYMGKVRRMAADFQGQFQEAMREAEMEDIKKQVDDIASSASTVTNFDPIGDLNKEFQTAIEDKPAQSAAPADAPPAAESTAPAEPDTSLAQDTPEPEIAGARKAGSGA
jgi:sec-independent protein translocase protein TatB